MKRAHTEVTSPKSAEEVYEYLVDFTKHPEWRFDVLESELVSGEAGQPGARYRQRVKPGRKEMVSESEVTKAEPGRAIAFKTVDDGPVSATGEWVITSQERGTQVVYDGTVEAHGFMRVFEPMMGPAVRKTAERYRRDLQERLGG